MIYVSSTCLKEASIKTAVEKLAEAGFRQIELSGGTHYYPNYLEDLQELKKKYDLSYRLHNYFPPPEKSFVLNLASTDADVLSKSKDMVKRAVDMSVLFGATKYGLHAGFRMSPSASELGQQIQKRKLMSVQEASDKFCAVYKELNLYAENKGVQLYIENNVFSQANFISFQEENPFLVTTSEEYEELQKMQKFPLLLDVAHLKVSCHTHKLDYDDQLRKMIGISDYIHLSDNDRTKDSNEEFFEYSDFFKILAKYDLARYTFTIEVYKDLKVLKDCYKRVEELLE